MYFERTSSKNLAKLKIEVERMKEMDEVVVQNDDDDSNVVHNVNPKSLISDNVYKVG